MYIGEIITRVKGAAFFLRLTNAFLFQMGLILKKGKMGIGEGKPIHKIIIFKHHEINTMCIVHGTFNMN